MGNLSQIPDSIEDLQAILGALNNTASVSRTDAAGAITYVNDKFIELTKYSREELIGQNHRIMKSGQHSEEFYNQLWSTISAGKVWRGEVKDKAKDGSLVWFDTSIAPILGKDGKPESYIAVRFPITEKKVAEEALQESESRFEAILDNAPIIIYIKDLEGRYVLINRHYESVTHLQNTYIQGKTDHDIFPKEVADIWRAEDMDVVRSGTAKQFEITIAEEGKPRTYLTVKFPLYDSKGKPRATCGISTDITRERAQEEEKIKVSEQAYDRIFKTVDDIIVTLSVAGVITSINPVFEKLTGWQNADWIGKEFMPLMHPEDIPISFKNMYEVALGHKIDPVEVRVKKKDGGYLVVESTISPIMEEGKVLGMFCIARDVTSRKEAEKVRQKVELNEAKEEFMFHTIHDLRAPNTILKMALSEYAEQGLTEKYPEAKDVFAMMQEANGRMEKLLEHLFQFAKGERKEIVLKSEQISLSEIIHAVLKEFSTLAKEKNISLNYEGGETPKILGDHDALQEVFANLVGNAIKYNKAGGSVSVSHKIKDRMLCTIIADTGIGIDEAGLGKLFKPYSRAYSGDIEGSGLGLYIVKKCLEKMGGTVEVASKASEGTTFTVLLPLPIEVELIK